jgi:hypothetical protein
LLLEVNVEAKREADVTAVVAIAAGRTLAARGAAAAAVH